MPSANVLPEDYDDKVEYECPRCGQIKNSKLCTLESENGPVYGCNDCGSHVSKIL